MIPEKNIIEILWKILNRQFYKNKTENFPIITAFACIQYLVCFTFLAIRYSFFNKLAIKAEYRKIDWSGAVYKGSKVNLKSIYHEILIFDFFKKVIM